MVLKNKKSNKNGGDSKSENGKQKNTKLIDDPRFSKVHTDPRFQNVPKKTSKVTIDSRFNKIFTDKRFASSSAKVDKRGKPKKQSENALRRYYHLEDVEDDDNSLKKVEEESEGQSSSESSESESEGRAESDDVSSTDIDDDDSDLDGVDMLDDVDSVEVENVPVIEEETHRLAVVNMDWNQVKAADLFMMLRSFLPKGGQIKSVSVYPSEFGLKRMEEEAIRGPIALLEDQDKKDVKDNDDEDDEEEEEEDESDDEMDPEKLRAYEKSRLRYYYAVVECDSIATADYLYKACDGVEFERSSNVLDLRFIPDTMEFPYPPRDVANEAPPDYEGLDFHTKALQQSNMTLSWDDDEPHRVKTLRQKFNEKQLAELELKEFLASDESDSDEDEGKAASEDDDEEVSSDRGSKKVRMTKKDMYRALVQSGGVSDENRDEDEGQDMEVTFNTGLEDISKKILEKKDKGSESVWEAYLRKKKEKKKARKYKSKNSSDDDSDDSDEDHQEQPGDFFEEEPSIGKNRKGKGNKKTKEERIPLEDNETAVTKEELELLLADEDGADINLKGYNMKQKKDKKKGKKGKEASEEEKLPTIDYDDPRFSALFTNPGFALDPTDPQFKRSATYFRQLAQRQLNDNEGHATMVPEPVESSRLISNDSSSKKDENYAGTSQKEKFELSNIVKSIKMKSQQLPKPSRVQVKKDNGSNMKLKKHKLVGLDRKIKKKTKV